ncbi:unnamed protein product [Penicillium bialowiezense]
MTDTDLEKKHGEFETVENVNESRHITDIDERLQALIQSSLPFYRKRNLTTLYLLMIPGCLLPAVTLGFDAAMMNGLQAIETWVDYFGDPNGSLLGLLTAILSLGAICGTPFISMVGDKYGRRKGLLLGSGIMAVGGIIQGASIHSALPTIDPFNCAPILIGELSHPKERQVITSLYQTTWCLGATIAAWVTFGTFAMPNEWAWRIPSLLQASPALIQMVGVLFVPESPRWLIAHGRGDEAKAILTKYHAEGDETDLMVELEYTEMKQVIEADLLANETTWRSMISNRGNRRRLLLMVMLGIFSQWSGNGLVSYYLARVLDTVGVSGYKEKNIINGGLMIWSWLCAVGAAFLTAYLRRRTQFMISTVGMLAVFASQTLCSGLFNEEQNQAAGTAVVAMLFLFYLFFNLAYNALLYSYPVEVLPYPVRAKGFAVLMFCGKGANFVNTLVNPIGLAAIGWKYYLVYVAWLTIEVGGVYFLLVETKGPSLEAIAARFDSL